MKTEVRKLDPFAADDYREAIHHGASLLAAGGIVVFPTETVYGVGANVLNPQALARLCEIKQRRETQPFAVLIGSRSSVDRFVPHLTGVGRRLIEKAWPGPLTLIFNVPDVQAAPVIRETSIEHAAAMYHEGTIGIRCPDDHRVADLLSEAQVPVVASSANPAGVPPAVDADEALAALDGQVDLVLDAGRARYGRPSTVVRVHSDGYEILREGVIDERTIRRLMRVNFLLVCTGNTCRSPMATGLLRHLLAERLGCPEHELSDQGYQVESVGTGAFEGASASNHAVAVMQKRGLDISDHRSQPLTLDQISRADYIWCMTQTHVQTVRATAGGADCPATRLADQDIVDPIGGSEADYEHCAGTIENALRRRLEEITF